MNRLTLAEGGRGVTQYKYRRTHSAPEERRAGAAGERDAPEERVWQSFTQTPVQEEETEEDMLVHLGHCHMTFSQPQGHHHSGNASSQPHTLYRMSEGDVTVLSLGPASLDLSRQERQSLTRLYCQNGGYHLRVLPDGTVTGGRQDNDTYDVLRLKAVNVGVVVIKGEQTGRYLAMNKDGRLYGSQSLNDECYFLEKYEENHYNTYRSQKYGWYVGLKRNGKPKAGPKTHQGQKAIYFLPRPVGNL